MGCLEFFTTNEGKQTWEELIKFPIEELVAWESDSASITTHGPVQNDEMLCRRVLSPVHFDKATSLLKASAFDETGSRGLSVNRLAYTTIVEIAKVARARPATVTVLVDGVEIVKEAPNKFWGCASFNCEEVRSIISQFPNQPEAIRIFGVYDTGLPADKSHADVFQIAAARDVASAKAFARSARLQLADLANKKLTQF